ncbi:MAG TPA: DUF4349 domain-containing protein [Anaerolineales bacterium]|nr:DUF4349 domain-containing protein [Anaerolineales bacterium]
MKSRPVLFTLSVLITMLVLAACGGGAAATEPPLYRDESGFANELPAEPPAATAAPAMPQEFGAPAMELKTGEEGDAAQASDMMALPMPTMAAFEIGGQGGENIIVQNTNRKVIKNADVRLLVKDTNVAVSRTTQAISDLGGYIISSRIWYQDYYGNNLMYATITLGIPVDEFEHALNRLRDLSIRVLDENASGEDVTDQYVDLQSQLANLEATRARILEFLEDAKTVEEALRINQELASIESQIEQIKGRMNFLSDRSAFSTITANFEPEFPVLTPTPTPTIAPTFTPRPTATLVPWKPGETFGDAQRTITVVYRGIGNFLIWLVVVILPIVLPPAIAIWLLWKLLNRKPSRPSSGKAEGD